jgi:hypothetical protein
MRDRGYAYAIVGGAGPADYYRRTVGATPIERSTPGIYDFGLFRADDGGTGVPDRTVSGAAS